MRMISFPRNKKELQSFLGKINFLRCFVPNFAELIKHINCMLKKGFEVKWNDAAHNSFVSIKTALTESPVLVSHNFEKDFLTFSYAFEETVAVVLLQKNDEGFEQPISFFSHALRDAELKYSLIEKQAYALVKALKAFRVYILHSKIIAFVPSIVVKYVLLQPDTKGKRGRWIAKILEFDIEIKPTKLIKGQGLAHLMADSNCKALSININAINEKTIDGVYDYPDIFLSDWYKDIIYFLQNCNCPPEMEK